MGCAVQHAASLQAPPAAQKQRAVFYAHTLCPYAQRVWLTLEEKKVPYTLVHIDLSHKPRWFSSINARGLVPALQWQGSTMVESTDICRWLDSTFTGDAHPSLTPSDASALQQMEQLLAGSSAVVSAGIDAVAGNSRSWGIGTRASAAQMRRFESEVVAVLAAALVAAGGPYLTGEQPSLADMVLMPFVDRFELVLRGLRGIELSSMGAEGAAVNSWLRHMRTRDSGLITCATEALLLDAYRQHMSLDFFDYQTYDATWLHLHLAEQLL